MTQKSQDVPQDTDAPKDAPQDEPQDAPQDEDVPQDAQDADSQDDAEEFVLDKKTYNYLLEMARLGQEQEAQPEQPPKPTKPKPDPVEPKQQEDGFFFLVKNIKTIFFGKIYLFSKNRKKKKNEVNQSF
jgi:hypothetical protein